jgi:hypothetical protein
MVSGVGECIQHGAHRGHLAVAIPVDIEQLGALRDGYVSDLDLFRAAALGEAARVTGFEVAGPVARSPVRNEIAPPS